jgi:hypothetical protein
MKMTKKKTKCVVIDSSAAELHDLYKKHEYRAISKENSISVCCGCGSWAISMDRADGSKVPTLTPLLPRDFEHSGPLGLDAVMKLLSPEQKLSLAVYLDELGYREKSKKHAEQIKKYLKKGAAI